MKETAITVLPILSALSVLGFALHNAFVAQDKLIRELKEIRKANMEIALILGPGNLKERIAAGIAIAEERRFMASKIGICDLKSLPSVSSEKEHNEVLRMASFGSRCVVTGSQATPNMETAAEFKLVHIVPRKILGNVEFMNDFDISVEDVDADGNALFLRADVEERLGKCEFCFWPHERGDGTFVVFPLTELEPEFYQGLPNAITIPDFVSRKMLFVHAMDAFRKAGRAMPDESAWTACDFRGKMIAEWLTAVAPAE